MHALTPDNDNFERKLLLKINKKYRLKNILLYILTQLLYDE